MDPKADMVSRVTDAAFENEPDDAVGWPGPVSKIPSLVAALIWRRWEASREPAAPLRSRLRSCRTQPCPPSSHAPGADSAPRKWRAALDPRSVRNRHCAPVRECGG